MAEVARAAAMTAGFAAAAGRAGIKDSGEDDLALIATAAVPNSASRSVAVAAAQTRNLLPAASVQLTRHQLSVSEPTGAGSYGWTDAVLVVSGCANSATGLRVIRIPAGVVISRSSAGNDALPVQVLPWLPPCQTICTRRPSGMLLNVCPA